MPSSVAKETFDNPILAEIFAAQGMPERAAGILRRVVRERPDDAAARSRLAQIEAQLPPPMGAAGALEAELQGLLEAAQGASAAAVLQADGTLLACAECGGSGIDVARLLQGYAGATTALRDLGGEQPLAGSLTELTLFTTNLVVVLHHLGEGAYAAMVLRPDGLAGKARYLLRQAADGFKKALACGTPAAPPARRSPPHVRSL